MEFNHFGHTNELKYTLQELARFGKEWDRRHPKDRMKQLNKETAQYLWAIVYCRAPNNILEVGCGSGYSTIWLASALKGTHGKLLSVDLDPSRLEIAREFAEKAEISEYVEFFSKKITVKFLRKHFTKGIEMLFLDCRKNCYLPTFKTILPFLGENALLIADNILSKQVELSGFLSYLDKLESQNLIQNTIIPCGNGLLASRFRP